MPGIGVEWGVDFVDGEMRARMEWRVRDTGVDVAAVVAAFFEIDVQGGDRCEHRPVGGGCDRGGSATTQETSDELQAPPRATDTTPSMNTEIVFASEIPQGCPADTVWHARSVTAGLGTRTDEVWRLSVVDALDEPLGAVVLLTHPLAGGEPAPAPAKGHRRWGGFRCAAAVCPSQGEGGAVVRRAFRAQVPWMLSALPAWSIRSAVERYLEDEVEKSLDYFRHSGALRQRMEGGERAALYARLGERLAGSAGEPAAAPGAACAERPREHAVAAPMAIAALLLL